MSVFNASLWIIAEIGAGWLTAVIARRPQAVWCLAVLVMGYLCFMHLYYVWHELPWLYNLVVACASGPAVLLGAENWAHARIVPRSLVPEPSVGNLDSRGTCDLSSGAARTPRRVVDALRRWRMT